MSTWHDTVAWFYDDRPVTDDYFPVTHMVIPFVVTAVLYRPWWTLMLVYAWETVEHLMFEYDGTYALFKYLDAPAHPETLRNALILDPFQGVLGTVGAYLLGRVLQRTTPPSSWKVAAWCVVATGAWVSSTRYLEWHEDDVPWGHYVFASVTTVVLVVGWFYFVHYDARTLAVYGTATAMLTFGPLLHERTVLERTWFAWLVAMGAGTGMAFFWTRRPTREYRLVEVKEGS